MRQTKLAVRQLLGAHKNSSSYRIVSYRIWLLSVSGLLKIVKDFSGNVGN